MMAKSFLIVGVFSLEKSSFCSFEKWNGNINLLKFARFRVDCCYFKPDDAQHRLSPWRAYNWQDKCWRHRWWVYHKQACKQWTDLWQVFRWVVSTWWQQNADIEDKAECRGREWPWKVTSWNARRVQHPAQTCRESRRELWSVLKSPLPTWRTQAKPQNDSISAW